MEKSLAEIARIINGDVLGDSSIVIKGLASIQDAKKGDLTFVANSKYLPQLKKTQASAILVSRDLKVEGFTVVRTDNPSLSFAKVFEAFQDSDQFKFSGIHQTAVIAENVDLSENVTVGPFSVVESGVSIGKNTIVHGGCYIGRATSIGCDCMLFPQVTVLERVQIGNQVTVHSGTVIGSDGFGYEFVDGVHHKIPQIGTVVIEDDVEIGANVTIDRARFDKTLIGRGTKIDNLVQIAHNVVIGENCVIVAQVGISGSTVIERNSILAGQAGLAGHLRIGEGSIVAAQAGVTKSIPPKSKVSGYPAKPHVQAARLNACLNKLPAYIEEIKNLRKRVKELEAKND